MPNTLLVNRDEDKLEPPQRDTLLRLQAFLREWQETGTMPANASGLSSGESWALAIAARQESKFDSPVAAFLVLDGWLQRWVMHQRGWNALIGTRLG